jgi:hypothetical protein
MASVLRIIDVEVLELSSKLIGFVEFFIESKFYNETLKLNEMQINYV